MVLSCIARRAFKNKWDANESGWTASNWKVSKHVWDFYVPLNLADFARVCVWLLARGEQTFMCRLGQQSPDKLCMYVASAACALKNLYKVLNVPCHGTEWQLQGGASTLLALWQYLKRVMEYSTNTDNMSQSHNPARPGPGQAMPGQDGTDQARPADNALIPCLQSAQVQILSGHSQ